MDMVRTGRLSLPGFLGLAAGEASLSALLGGGASGINMESGRRGKPLRTAGRPSLGISVESGRRGIAVAALLKGGA